MVKRLPRSRGKKQEKEKHRSNSCRTISSSSGTSFWGPLHNPPGLEERRVVAHQVEENKCEGWVERACWKKFQIKLDQYPVRKVQPSPSLRFHLG
ncbi:hypothetical protein NPIL_392111 [Nephila pilipes]|uniref:Uncharacterized protein n=1 Tax=Nephila pilipes TaxID=299642 RepID=A0A8X6N8X0_NEPPI|nr:hypothetical protein NPIL_392111 [Nephila pilipes]